MSPSPPPLSTIFRASSAGVFVALLVALVASPPNHSALLRVLELFAIIVLGVVTLAAVVELVIRGIAGWHETEAEFELIVRRTERLAREHRAADPPSETELMVLDPFTDADFEELVQDALDELPDLLRNALDHVAVVISDGGRRAHAYGLYEGDAGRAMNHAHRIVIFRDTLRRDFGHDPSRLREQVTRTVRHELAHHVGFDELGVRDLGL
jgi:predicted Zn-dependent protease with MMP-like domain